MLAQGINLMLFGMGTVFVFLTLLVFFTTTMSVIIARSLPAVEVFPQAVEAQTSDQLVQGVPDQTLIAAVEAAIAQHRLR